jgi:transcriptional regulator with XRE-family HTH domain
MADITPIEEAPRRRSAEPEPLWREVLGRRLRELRSDREEKLVDTARRAGISPQYLSEIERGIKEPSSEMISAVAGALDTTLAEIASGIGRDLGRRANGPVRASLALAA